MSWVKKESHLDIQDIANPKKIKQINPLTWPEVHIVAITSKCDSAFPS